MPPVTLSRVVTIGVYGYDEPGFFAALAAAGVDTFCDLRYRRGVRGAQYAFANRQRLEARLGALGIRYLHFRDLAPSPALRQRQYAADRTQHTTKRGRVNLSLEFVAGYHAECLTTFDSRRFLEQLGSQARVVALCCVEGTPGACHRSLVAARLARDLGLETLDLIPR